jgi:hypothetical protein
MRRIGRTALDSEVGKEEWDELSENERLENHGEYRLDWTE